MDYRDIELERVHRIKSKLQLRAPLHAIIAIREFSGSMNAGECADALIESLNLSGSVLDWQTIPPWFAVDLLGELLNKGLAHREADSVMGRQAAEETSRLFIDAFRAGSVFYSNGDHFSQSYTDESNGALGEATFEKGIIAVDGLRAGMLWLQDED